MRRSGHNNNKQKREQKEGTNPKNKKQRVVSQKWFLDIVIQPFELII
jgi:hypothetical protein